MFRLAMLRDDTVHEMAHIYDERVGNDHAKMWRSAYAIRRMFVIITEAKDLFAGTIEPWLHAHKNEVTDDVKEWIGKWKAQLETTIEFLKPLRDGFGGHVKPASVRAGEGKEIKDTHIQRMIEGLGGATVAGVIDLQNQRGTQFHRITGEFFLLAWPDVLALDDDGSIPSEELIIERYRERHKRLSDIVFESGKMILVAGASLLRWFWTDLEIAYTTEP